MWLYSPVCVRPGRKPRRSVFSQRGPVSTLCYTGCRMRNYILVAFIILGGNVGSPCSINANCSLLYTECWSNVCTCTPGYVFDSTTQACMTGLYKYSIAFKRLYLSLAHISRRLIGELIGYSWSGVRPSVVRRPSVVVVNNFKHPLLQNRLPKQSQILSEACLGRGNDSLFAACGSHDLDGRHAHIW